MESFIHLTSIQHTFMDILSIPFHEYIDIGRSDKPGYIFEINERPEYLNHLGTIHACVQLSLAEAASGEFLIQEFNELQNDVIPVVRKSEARYHRPANGKLHARAEFYKSEKKLISDDLEKRSRAILKVKVEVFDSNNHRSLTAIFDWFITKK